MIRVRAAALMAATLVLAACSFSGSSGTDQIDAGQGTVDAGDSGVDAGAAASCGGPAVYVDNFAGPEPASHWNLFRDQDLTFDQALIINPFFSNTPAGVTSGQLFDLTGDHVTVEVSQHFAAGSGRTASFVVARASDTFFGFHMDGDELTVELAVDGQQMVNMSVSLDRVAHRYLRLSEAAGTIAFETSPDNSTFTTFTTASSPAFVTAVRVQLLAIDGGGSSDPIRFENLNPGRDPTPWCGASSFVDAFSDGVLDRQWQLIETSTLCSPTTESGNAIHFTLGAGSGNGGLCSIRSAPAYDLTDDSFTIEVPAIGDTDIERFMVVYDDQDSFVGLSLLEAGLCTYAYDAPNDVTDPTADNCITYESTHNFWRFRGDGGAVFVEVSADQMSWTPIISWPAAFSLADVDVGFGGFDGAALVGGGAFTVAEFNPVP